MKRQSRGGRRGVRERVGSAVSRQTWGRRKLAVVETECPSSCRDRHMRFCRVRRIARME